MHIAVVGATGTVGRGVVSAALDLGWTVTAAGRDEQALSELSREGGVRVRPVTGSLNTSHAASELASAIRVNWVDAVVLSVSNPWEPLSLLGTPPSMLEEHWTRYLRLHLNGLTLLDSLKKGGTFIGIGGGMADVVVPGMSAVSVAQAGQRMLYRHAAKEARGTGVTVREALIASMVADEPHPSGLPTLSARAVGERVCELADRGYESKDVVVTIAA